MNNGGLANNSTLLVAVARIVFYTSKVRGAYVVESLLTRTSEPAPTFLYREGGPRHCGQGTHDFEIVESGRMSSTKIMAVVGGTDRALLPHIGNKARLLYRESGGPDSSGVIRLTCGSTCSNAFAPAIIGSRAMTQFRPPSLAA